MKYIFYAAFSDYWRIANHDLYQNKDTHVCEGVNAGILNYLSRVHNSWKLNSKGELPFKSIWFKQYTAYKYLDRNQKQFAIFPEANSLSFSGKYLKFLRKNYPKLVVVFSFSNPCGDYNLKKLETVRPYYDHIITFNDADCRQYGFELIPIGGYSRIEVPDSNIPESDMFFIGQDKGRLSMLLQIYDRMTSLGLKCDFSIVRVKDEDIVTKQGITYNKRMTYMEVLQHVKKTKCVLEVLEGKSDYSSIRETEALTYRKKLITMSSSVLKSAYYSPSQMLYIHNPDEITRDFFETPIINSYDISDYSPIKGLETIAKLNRTKP